MPNCEQFLRRSRDRSDARFLSVAFTTPIIGILIGLSSKRKGETNPRYNAATSQAPKPVSSSSKLLDQLQELERVKALGIEVDGLDAKIEQLKTEIASQIKQDLQGSDFTALEAQKRISVKEIRPLFEKYNLAQHHTDHRFVEQFINSFPLIVAASESVYRILLTDENGYEVQFGIWLKEAQPGLKKLASLKRLT